MEIKSLGNTNFDRIWEAFGNAFEDYESQVNKEQLKVMLKRRGFVPELSFAAFDDDAIVSFTLNGIGNFNNISTAYDTGTGTIKEFRGRNLSSEIFAFSIPWLKKANIRQYLLEVLQHNSPAVHIYQKNGFEITRGFNYFMQKQQELAIRPADPDSPYVIRQTALSDCKHHQQFCDFPPSWQNSFDAIGRKPDDFLAFGAFLGPKLTGYCILEPNTGDITQIAVDREHRRKGAGSLLLGEALKHNRHDSVKLLNADVDCGSIAGFAKAINLELKGKQFEMIKEL